MHLQQAATIFDLLPHPDSQMTDTDPTTSLLDDLFAAIDRNDPDQFVSFLTENARFRFGSQPPVTGRSEIRDAVAAFFDSIDGCSHHVRKIWRDSGNRIACEGEVSYRRIDRSEITLPFVDVFELDGALIDHYKIYIDIAPLYTG